MAEDQHKSGFIAVIGPTNAGKSTLVNALVGQKVSIVSSKVQTTYHSVRGIVTDRDVQFVYVDTPGFQKRRERLAQLLNRVAEKQAADADFVLWVFDVSSPYFRRHVEAFLPKIRQLKKREHSYAVLNKIDQIPKPQLLPILQWLDKEGVFAEVIPVSALKKDGLKQLVSSLRKILPAGPAFYPAESRTDRSLDFQMTERVREKIYQVTRQEIPYSVRVEIEPMGEHVPQTKVPTIFARIHVDSSSRKGILIGKGAQVLKTIGQRARMDIQEIVGHKICLKLHVDVEEGWRDDRRTLQRYLELS